MLIFSTVEPAVDRSPGGLAGPLRGWPARSSAGRARIVTLHRVAPEALAPRLPEGLTLRTHGGAAWLTVPPG